MVLEVEMEMDNPNNSGLRRCHKFAEQTTWRLNEVEQKTSSLYLITRMLVSKAAEQEWNLEGCYFVHNLKNRKMKFFFA
jgi:hypothetical protein